MTEVIRDAWEFYKGHKDTNQFNEQVYTRDRRIYLERDENTFEEFIKKSKFDLKDGITAYSYNLYPSINIIIPNKGEVRICYLLIQKIEDLIPLIENLTGLEYDPTSPDSSPESGLFELTGNSKLIKSINGMYYIYDSCSIIVQKTHLKNMDGCSVEIRFQGIIQ